MRYEIYEDNHRGWRWRAVARNGRIVADGAEGYATKANARRAVWRFLGHYTQGLGLDNADIVYL